MTMMAQVSATTNRAASRLKRSLHQLENTKLRSPTNEQTLWWWIIGLAGGIIVILLLYFLVIFPAMVHSTGLANSSKYTPTVTQIKPQTPIFNAPTSHTNQATLTVSGFATPETTVHFVFNDTEETAADTVVGINGEFSTNFTLVEGDNTIQAYATDQDNLTSDLSRKYTINYDQTQPTLSISEPTDGQALVGKEKKTLTLKGTTEAKATVVVNQTRTTAGDDGAFELNYQLNQGENKLVISATDAAGNTISSDLTVTFTP